jgi:hypothetical protein
MNTDVDIYPLVAFPFGLDYTTSNETVSFKYASIHTRERGGQVYACSVRGRGGGRTRRARKKIEREREREID